MTAVHPATASREGPDTIGFRSSGTSPTLHLIGAGRVGRSLLRLLRDTGHRLVGLSDSSATIFRRDGLDLLALERWKERGRRLADLPGAEPIRAEIAVGLVGADLVLDATSTEERGTADAVARGRAALRAGAHLAVAAKNGLRAAATDWLLGTQRRVGCNAALGGTGLQLQRELPELRERCDEVAAVANVSTTAILQEVERGASLEQGIAAARERGFLEADPTRDLDGSDAAEKLCIVASALWGRFGELPVAPDCVEREDVRTLDPRALRERRGRGCTTRLVARACRGGALRVAFEELPASSPLAVPPDRVVYAYRLGDRLRVHTGAGVGHERTARALLQDVLAVEGVQ